MSVLPSSGDPASQADFHEDNKGPPMVLKDEELVNRAQKEDQRAIEELFNRYLQKAYAIAYHLCYGDSQDAQDLVQEAFLKALRNIKKFRGNSSFYTWFYRIIVNTYLDSIKRRRGWERIFSFWQWRKPQGERTKSPLDEQPDAKEYSNPVMVLSDKELSRDIRKALMSLPDKQRIVFQLKVLHGMSIREIAKVMGSAEGTIKSHLFRATHFLQRALQEWTIS